MASSNLLKEAIADAKAVRETAIANAKLALEEAFTPRLQSMLSNKIEEELEENEELEEQSDSSNIGAGDNKVNQASGDDEEKSETEKTSAAYGSEDSNVKVVDKLTEEAEEDEETEMEDEKEEEMDMDMDSPADDEDDEMDMELEAIIKELEDEETEMEDEETEMEDEEETAEMKEEAEDEETEMEDEESEMKEEVEEVDEELNIESILSALKEEDDEETEMEDEKEEMKEQLEEAYNTIKSLKSTLNEVNLLNAKLMFSNKLFKSQDLTESQKMRVIETFDRASNLREVKLVYTTLAESMQSRVTKVAKKKATVTEGLASKAQKTTKPKTVIAEGNEMASRMKKLAVLL